VKNNHGFAREQKSIWNQGPVLAKIRVGGWACLGFKCGLCFCTAREMSPANMGKVKTGEGPVRGCCERKKTEGDGGRISSNSKSGQKKRGLPGCEKKLGVNRGGSGCQRFSESTTGGIGDSRGRGGSKMEGLV